MPSSRNPQVRAVICNAIRRVTMANLAAVLPTGAVICSDARAKLMDEKPLCTCCGILRYLGKQPAKMSR